MFNDPISQPVVPPQPPQPVPAVSPVQNLPPTMPPSQTFSSSMGPQMQTETKAPSGKKGDFLFKIVVVLAILSVLILLGALGYYLYSASQKSASQNLTTKVASPPTPIVSPSVVPQGAVLSESDKTDITDAELNNTELEDFESEFTVLLKEMAEL